MENCIPSPLTPCSAIRAGESEVHHQPGCGDAWFVTCKQLEIVSIALFEEDVYEAINKASKIVRDAIERLYIDAKKM